MSSSKTFKVAHHKLPVLVNILQKDDTETTLRYGKIRIGECVATQSRKQIVFEKCVKVSFKSHRRAVSKQAWSQTTTLRRFVSWATFCCSAWNTTTSFNSRGEGNIRLCWTVKETCWRSPERDWKTKLLHLWWDRATRGNGSGGLRLCWHWRSFGYWIRQSWRDPTVWVANHTLIWLSVLFPFYRLSVVSIRAELTRLEAFITMKRTVWARGEEGGSVKRFCRRRHPSRRRCEHDCHETTTICPLSDEQDAASIFVIPFLHACGFKCIYEVQMVLAVVSFKWWFRGDWNLHCCKKLLQTPTTYLSCWPVGQHFHRTNCCP